MQIKKYRPPFFEGFEDVVYNVNSKEELMGCELVKSAAKYGTVCFAKGLYSSHIMVVIEKDNERGCEWYVLSIIHNEQDIRLLSEWLPDFNKIVEKYKKEVR